MATFSNQPAPVAAKGSKGGSLTNDGLGGGGGKGGISASSPIGQWLQSQGLAPTLGRGANDSAITADWNKLPAMQQLSLLNAPQGGMSLFDALVAGGNSQSAMGDFLSNTNRSAGYGLSDVNTRGPNIGSPIQAYGGQQGGYAPGGLFGPGGAPPTTPGSTPPGTTPPPVTPPPPGLNRPTGPNGSGGGDPRQTGPGVGTVQRQAGGGAMPMQLPPQVLQALMQWIQKGAAR